MGAHAVGDTDDRSGTAVRGDAAATDEPDLAALAERAQAALVRTIDASGAWKDDPVWREAFTAVPRHLFVPYYYVATARGYERRWGEHPDPGAREEWLRGAYADVPLASRLRDGELVSSSSQPSLMARMLAALRIEDGNRVLEIGAGTGYNAALIAHRLGDDGLVTTVDLDPEITESARRHLAAAGHHPAVVTGDGARGVPERAPYDRIIATCADERRELSVMGVPEERVDIVPCGVDVDQFAPMGQAAPRSRRHRILVLGRLVRRKGIEDVIRAIAQVPDAELVVAGGPPRAELSTDPEADRLQGLVDELRLQDRVQLVGRVSRADLPALIRSCDVVTCVPWYEPFGIVPLEAMACGVPVVASSVGGLLDTVIDGVTGIQVPPRRPDRLAAALRELLADPRRRARLGTQGRQSVEARYAWPLVAAEVERSYLRAVAQRRTAAVGVVG